MRRGVIAAALLLSSTVLATPEEDALRKALSDARTQAEEHSKAARYREAEAALVKVVRANEASAPKSLESALENARKTAAVYAERARLAKTAARSVDDSKGLLQSLLFNSAGGSPESPTTEDPRIHELVEQLVKKDSKARVLAPRVVKVSVEGTAAAPVVEALSAEVQRHLASYGFKARGQGPTDALKIVASATEPQTMASAGGFGMSGAAADETYVCAVKAEANWTSGSETTFAALDLGQNGMSLFKDHCQRDNAKRGGAKVMREIIRAYLGVAKR